MHFLVTGHTGFKGSWLSWLLHERGHQISGLSLEPVPGSLFLTTGVHGLLEQDVREDIRNYEGVLRAISRIQPDVVIHMAAQPLVRESYLHPRLTIETNVVGTSNVMEAVRRCDSVQAQLIVTTDKVYRNVGQSHGYIESDALGGHDPYSASKAAADLIAQSLVASFDGPSTAIARAGNVIGGGDVSTDRLLPDLIRGFKRGDTAEIRYPQAIRPWQHVLDCLEGYLALVHHLLDGGTAGEWNFGPGEQGFVTVGAVADFAASRWSRVAGEPASWRHVDVDHPHEAAVLALDAGKAEKELKWRNRLGVSDAVGWTIDWELESRRGSPLEVTKSQIRDFSAFA